jgi:hypothetical protein
VRPLAGPCHSQCAAPARVSPILTRRGGKCARTFLSSSSLAEPMFCTPYPMKPKAATHATKEGQLCRSSIDRDICPICLGKKRMNYLPWTRKTKLRALSLWGPRSCPKALLQSGDWVGLGGSTIAWRQSPDPPQAGATPTLVPHYDSTTVIDGGAALSASSTSGGSLTHWPSSADSPT